MDGEFDYEYEDDLDAMIELENDLKTTDDSKGRKSLDFSTPSAKLRPKTLNDSFPTPLESITDDSDVNSPSVVKSKTESSQISQKASRKRMKDDMYGNLSDDDDENKEPEECDDLPDLVQRKKRQRISKESDNEDIDNFEVPAPPELDQADIIKMRRARLSKVQKSNTIQDYEERLAGSYEERQRIFTKIPQFAFVPATSSEGKRVYMKLKSEDQMKNEVEKSQSREDSLHVLGTPLAVLKAQVEEERQYRIRKEQENSEQIIAAEIDDDDDEVVPGHEEDSVKNLWVEKYSPARYTDLLSDETTNRSLLKWLKLWDQVVFGREKAAPKIKAQNKKQEKQEMKKYQNRNISEVSDDLDDHNRPLQKVALLSGPPGLGKTTLAHVIAHHAGYNVVEMNASDDRTADIFKQKIEAATQMKAVMGDEKKPNCLIIDEIDGAPQPAINMLMNTIKDEVSGSNKKKNKERNLLQRPIICICNDLYVPALRQLRQMALVITFPPTVSTKLASRLLEITKKEKLKTDLTTLLALCEKTENDIRSCLNTLQFIRGRCRVLGLQSVNTMSLGQKDSHKTLFNVWQHIFKMPKQQRKRYVNPYDRSTAPDVDQDAVAALNQSNISPQARFHNTLQMALAAGEDEKVMQGLHENYLEAKVKDPHMDCVLAATEWMCFNDTVFKEVGHRQDFTLFRYTPYLSVAFHLLFAANHPNRVMYPHAQFENHTKTNKTNNLVMSMLNDVTPAVRKNLNITVTVTEFLPPLLDIIQPTLRPVNTQLYSAREKQELANLVRIMIAYNMTFRQERSLEGQYNYLLEPNMEEVVCFPEQRSKKQLTYAAKQLIAREIELERMRRSEGVQREDEKKKDKMQQQPAKEVKRSDGESNLPNYKRQTLQPKAIIEPAVEKPVLDFFGRRVVKKEITDDTGAKKKEDSKGEVIGGDIWFRFKEGYSNAVRKMVRIQDLM